MIRRMFFPELLDTGVIDHQVFAIRDRIMNVYVVRGQDGLVCIDAGWVGKRIRCGFEMLGLDIHDVAAVFLTHLHRDHARAWHLFSNAKVYFSRNERVPSFVQEKPKPGNWAMVDDREMVHAAGLTVRVVGTPGHTPGSTCYLVDGRLLVTGDAIQLVDGRAKPFHKWASADRTDMENSIRKLARISGIECVLTSHTGLTRDVARVFEGCATKTIEQRP